MTQDVFKYLQPNAAVPIDMETTALLVNALRQAIAKIESQEPVELPCCGYTDASAIKWNSFNGVVQCHNCGQTYTPPQRTWVELTDEQMLECNMDGDFVVDREIAKLNVQAKLKDMNT